MGPRQSLLSILVRHPGRVAAVLFNAARMWRAVAQFVEERARGDFFSVREGSLTDEEYGLLAQLVEQANGYPGPIVEIGTLLGATTTRLAGWKAPGKVIITVDNYGWDRWGLTSDTQFGLVSLVLYHQILNGQVTICRQDKNAWYKRYKGEAPALFFCDAVHDYDETKADIAWARAVGARIVAGHDYSPRFPGVMRAVDEAGGPARLSGTLWALPVVGHS